MSTNSKNFSPIPSADEAMAFLTRWAENGPWVLTAISTDRKQVRTRSFEKGREAAMQKWIKSHNGVLNIYFLVNSCVELINKKSKRENIKAMDWLHVDIDPRPREDLADEKERALKRVREGVGGLPAPSVIIDSGNGIQAFWKLDKPVVINGDPDAYEDAKLFNRYIENAYDADDCHNVDRIMRLPGTINLPNDKKKKAGRKPQLSSLIEFNDSSYPIDKFKKAPKADTTQGTGFDQDSRIAVQVGGNIQRLDTIDDLPEEVGLLCRVVIVQGHDPDNKDKWGSQSEAVWWVTNELIRAGCDDETIFSVLTDPGFAISEHIFRQPKQRDYTLRQIARAKANNAKLNFVTNDKDRPIANSRHNVRLAIENLGVEIAYDSFLEKDVVTGLESFGPVLDDDGAIRLWFMVDEFFNFLPPKNLFFDVLADIAKFNRFHPVRDYLNKLQWDEKPRLDRWLIDYAGAEDTAFNRAVGRLALIAAVRRVRQPGVKFDEMLVLESEQGANKSTALKVLAVKDEWFLDDLPLNADTKRVMEALPGKWIVEASELNGIRQGGVEHLKNFLSRTSDKARMAYDRYVKEIPRQCLIIGTTNDCHYLRDTTGNRRFWPVKIAILDIEALKSDVNQLWAEAAHEEANGETIRLNQSLWDEATKVQNARKAQDPFYEKLLAVLGDDQPIIVRSTDVWTILEISPGMTTQDHNKRIGQAMRSLGFERKRQRFGGQSAQYCYVREDELSSEKLLIWESGLSGKGRCPADPDDEVPF